MRENDADYGGTPYREFNLTGEFLAGPRVFNGCDGRLTLAKKMEE